MYVELHVKYPLFLSDFKERWIFSTDFRKCLTYQMSPKSVQWEPGCSMRTYRQTDMTKLRVTLRNLANVPKILSIIPEMSRDGRKDSLKEGAGVQGSNPCRVKGSARCYLRVVKRACHEIEHSPPLMPRFRISGAVPVLPPYAFMACTWRTL
jgi:hypothetical protein